MSRTDWIPSLWLDVFDELLNEDNELDYEDVWSLNFNYTVDDTVTKDERKRGWKVYCHRSYAKFRCASCYKTWGSARVVVLFRYRLRNGRGTVIMRPFGQTCRQCRDDEYDLPGFAQKDVEKSLLCLFAKIRKNCYGEEDDDDGASGSSTKVFTKPHEAALCQACSLGICCQDEG